MEIIDLYLFNNKKELIDIISDGSLIDNEQEQHLNGLITHTVSGVYTDSVEDADYFGLHDVDDNGVFWRYRIDTKNKREGKFTLDGTYELFDDLKGKKIITDLRPYNYTAVRALTALLDGTGWEVGNVSTSKIGYSNWYYINTLSAFWDFLEKWGVEFKPRMTFSQGKVIGRYIDIADRISDDYGKWYEYGSDLLTVEAETDLTNIATAYYGRGKGEEVSSAEENESGQAGYGRKINFADIVWSKSDGDPVDKPLNQQFVELPELTELYGFEDGTPRYDIVEFSDIEDKAELLQATYDYAIENARPKVQFKSTVNETDIAELGEVVTIIRDDLNIRYKTRIFKIKRSFFNNKIKDFEFGDELIISQAKSTKQAQKAMQKQIDEANTFWLVALREAITDSFWNEDGYNYDLRTDNEYGLPSGYYSFDRPIDQNPTKAIYMGAGKLLISNSKDPNGEWVWETALDGDGVMAEKIVGYNSEFVKSSWNEATGGGVTITGAGVRALNPEGSRVTLENGVVSVGNRAGVNLGFFGDHVLNKDATGTMTITASLGTETAFISATSANGVTYKRSMSIMSGASEIDMFTTLDMNKNNLKDVTDIGFTGGHIKGTIVDGSRYLTIDAGTGTAFDIAGVTRMSITSVVNVFSGIDMRGNDIASVGKLTYNSDKRLKTNIKDTDIRALDAIRNWKLVSYDWLESGEHVEIGLISQDSPEVMIYNVESDIYGIDAGKQTMINTLAIQQLDSETDDEISQLKAQVASLQDELSELKELLKEKGVI